MTNSPPDSPGVSGSYNLILSWVVGVFHTPLGLTLYLIKASLLVLEDETYLLHLTKRLYPDIALAFRVTPARVERSLRTAINSLWEQGCIAAVEELVGYRIKEKPYVGEFIDILCGYFRSNLCA